MKRREFMKRIMALALSGMMCAGMIQMPVSAEANAENATVSVYPVPQNLTTESLDGMQLTGTVDVVVHGEQDAATLPKLKALLGEEKYAYSETSELGENAAIVLATNCGKESCSICHSVADAADALSKEQGYVLKTSNGTNEKGQITIVGADADGTYYGVMTLLQLFKQKTSDGRIAEVTISDYPDVEFRGYVEGFYGFPWSFNDRKELFEDTSLYKMNTYIYAPKDDPYHRDSWRTLYPAEEAENLTALAQIAADNNMEFCWTIHPGADYSYNGDSDYNKLIAKLEQVYSFGVRQFGIFYDDLSYSVANGTRHATVINNAYQYLQDKYGDVKPFITVLTRYTNSWGADMYSYFRPFMQLINEDTIVLWTGNSTMSAITYDYFQWPQNQTGIDRDFGVWWNYPVNDYCDGHLLMSPLHCLDNDVTNICSFFLNPMSEADASKVAIYSGADYSWNMGDFDSQSSWERAIYELVPEANEAFERFADNIGYVNEGSGFVFEESVYLEEDLNNFETALQTGEGLETALQTLKERFEEIVTDADALKLIEDAELLEEITVYLDAYKVLGQAGTTVMEAYEAAMTGDIEACIAKTSEASELLAESAEYTIPVFNDGKTTQVRAYVGAHRLVPFLETVMDGSKDILNENLITPRNAKVLTNVDELEAEVSVSGEIYSVNNISATMNKDDYVAIALPKAVCIEKINTEVAPAENFKVQYSLNGIEWIDAEGSEVLAMGAYVRVLCTKDETNAVITEVSAVTAEVAEELTGTVSTNMGTYQSYRIYNALDGNMNTKYYSDQGANAGDYIQVNFGGKTMIENAVIYFGGSPNSEATAVDGFASTKLQASVDGSTWTDVSDAVEYTSYAHIGNGRYAAAFSVEGGVQAQYLRFTATKSGDNWVQVYEMEFNDVSIVKGTASLGQASYIDDGDLGTAPLVSNIKEGDTIIYPMTTITDVGTIGIYQEATAISNAVVSVQKLDGTWEDVGTLGTTWNVFDVNETILAVKLTFDGTVNPVICEIIVTEHTEEIIPDEKEKVTEIFTDIAEGKWYVTNVQYVYDKGLMSGNDGLFNPTGNVTRAQLVTTLYRLAGNPEVTDYSACDVFEDVKLDKYYTDAVCWAYNENVTTGNPDTGLFNTTGTLTRQQMAAFFFRFAEFMRLDTEKRADFSDMLNADKVSGYAKEAVEWAVGSGLISGSLAGTDANGVEIRDLNPQGATTRAQLAAILQRFCEGNGF